MTNGTRTTRFLARCTLNIITVLTLDVYYIIHKSRAEYRLVGYINKKTEIEKNQKFIFHRRV